MAKPKNKTIELIETLEFPLKIALITLRKLQELSSEMGMGEFISYNAEADRQLKTFINLQDRIIKVIFALTPPNIFYSLHFDALTRYPFLFDYFQSMPAFRELWDYYRRHGKLPQPENPIESFLNLLSNFKLELTPDFLLTILTGGIYQIFKTLWNTIGNALTVLESTPMELLNHLEKTVKVDESLIVNSLLDEGTAQAANPFEGLYYAVICSTIALKEAYELPSLTPLSTAIKLTKIRPYLAYGTTKLLVSDGTELKTTIQPTSPLVTFSIELSELLKLADTETVELIVEHEGVRSQPTPIYLNPDELSSWRLPMKDSTRGNYAPTANEIAILSRDVYDRLFLRIYDRELNVTMNKALTEASYKAIFKSMDEEIWLFSKEGKLRIINLIDETDETHETLVENATPAGLNTKNKLLIAKETSIGEIKLYEISNDGTAEEKAIIQAPTYETDYFNVFLDSEDNIYLYKSYYDGKFNKRIIIKLNQNYEEVARTTYYPAYSASTIKPSYQPAINTVTKAIMFNEGWTTIFDQNLEPIFSDIFFDDPDGEIGVALAQPIAHKSFFVVPCQRAGSGSTFKLAKVDMQGKVLAKTDILYGKPQAICKKSYSSFLVTTTGGIITEFTDSMEAVKTIKRDLINIIMKGRKNHIFGVKFVYGGATGFDAFIVTYKDNLERINEIDTRLTASGIRSILV